MDGVVSLVILLIVAALALLFAVPDSGTANPADSTFVPRPAWYFLAPFQLLKYIPAPFEPLATAVLPLLLAGALFFLPQLARRRQRHPLDRPLISLVGLLLVLSTVALALLGAFSR